MATIIVTGIAGSLARLTALELLRRGDEVIGVDYRPKPKSFPKGVVFYRANYNKTRIADVFRRHKPDAVFHLGRVATRRVDGNKRFDLNVVGSAKIQELAVRHEVRVLVVLSTYHIYGAHPHNHVPIVEDEPVRALQTVPELSDAIQLDTQAVTWTYRHRKMRTIVLRPSNIIGPHINNTTCRYLRLPRIPYLLGFNPMWQFIHETDLLRALLAAVDSQDKWGAYNVTGRGALPIVEALKLSGAPLVPVPTGLLKTYLRLNPGARPAIPGYLVDFLKYPVITSDQRFRDTFGFEAQVGVTEAIRSSVTRMPMGAIL